MKKKESKKQEVQPGVDDSATKNEPETPEEETSQKTKSSEEDYKTLYEKERKARKDFEKALKIEKEKRRAQELSGTQPQKKETTDEEEEPDEIRQVIREELARKEAETYEQNREAAWSEFISAHPEYSEENDLNGEKYAAFREEYNNLQNKGITKDQILSRMEFVHRGMNNSNPTEETQVEVEDIGAIQSQPKKLEKQDSILTRPLNKYEQAAADNYPGGEDAYRKARAKKEE